MNTTHLTRALAVALASCVSLPFVAIAQSESKTAQATSSLVTAPPVLTVDAAIARANEAIAKIVAIPDAERTFDNTLGAIDDLLANFESDTSLLVFMSNVSTDAAVREASQKAEEQSGNYAIEVGKREDLYKAVMAYANTHPKLEGEQKRFLDFTLRDYRRAGMNLPPDKRAELTKIQQEINSLGIEFMKNIAEDDTVVPLTAAELKGTPEDVLKACKKSGDMYLVGMAYPIYVPTITNCDNETTREKLWLAYKRRGGQKNVTVLEKVIKLRAQSAQMLGYDSCSAYESEVRMVKNVDTIKKFYDELRPLVRKKALQDYAELVAAKRDHTKDPKAELMPWDLFFYQNYLLKTKYAVDSERVREYFPMQAVVDGLFKTTQSLYGLEYKDITSKAGTADRPLWHPDVKLYEVWDKASNRKIGEFYLDLYPRENKYTHAAQWSLINHKKWSDGHETLPLAALVCNFTKPSADKPSLLEHKEEVETFFHEFGHCLHTIVSEAKMNRFAGTNVEQDFVEAPSQMFENWVWSPQVLATFAKHYKTGEPMPKELIESMLKARNLGSGMDAEQQFYYGLTDQAYESTPDGKVDTTKVAHDLFQQIMTYKVTPEFTFYQASFGHLINYSAGYYGYMWSLVYASDMAVRFKELGMLSPEAGMYYRKKIISQGGTRDAMDLVRDYLGREPKLDSFLDHLGLEKKN
jgi:thimet oligopeptidase